MDVGIVGELDPKAFGESTEREFAYYIGRDYAWPILLKIDHTLIGVPRF